MNKCKGCEWNGKPYWSIINPCDNCPRENTNIEILTRWQDTTIEEYKKEISRLNNIIEELEKELRKDMEVYICGRSNAKTFRFVEKMVKAYYLDKLKELKEGK